MIRQITAPVRAATNDDPPAAQHPHPIGDLECVSPSANVSPYYGPTGETGGVAKKSRKISEIVAHASIDQVTNLSMYALASRPRNRRNMPPYYGATDVTPGVSEHSG